MLRKIFTRNVLNVREKEGRKSIKSSVTENESKIVKCWKFFLYISSPIFFSPTYNYLPI